MGLGLHCRAQLRDQERWGSDSALLKIEEIAEERAQFFGLRAFFLSSLADNKLSLTLHPAAEPVLFELLESGTIECDAKTSSVGPGYHAHLVELLIAVSEKTGIAWNFDEEEVDDTGFVRHRDFARLQSEMANFLRDLSGIVAEHSRKGVKGLMLNMPLGFVPRLHFGVGTPLGEWPTERFTEAADPDFGIERFASHFFPWWDQGTTANTWLNLGLIDLWMTISWRVPVDDDERKLFKRAITSFATAENLQNLKLPTRELRELNNLLVSPSSQTSVPSSDGIGYRRRLLQENLAGGWSIEIPGYFYGRLEDDGSTEVFWYGDREVWFTSFSLEPVQTPRMSDVEEDAKPGSKFINHFGIVGRRDTTQKGGHSTMSCTLQGTGTSAVASIIYTDPNDEDWAQMIFESIRHNSQ